MGAVADFDAGLDSAKRGDYAAALREFRSLAEQGNARAQFNVGIMYVKGRDVPEDDVQAYAWFNLAAAQGDEDASENKGILSMDMTLAKIAEAQKLSKKLCAKIPGCAQ